MSEQKDIDQRLKLVEEALNDFWFEQDERMIVRHRRLAEKIERKLNELEKRIYDLEPLTTRFPELSKPTPEALPICPHCSKPINRRRVASDVCMCAWKGVPGKPEATPCEHRQDTGTGLKVCNRPPIQVPAPQPEQTMDKDKIFINEEHFDKLSKDIIKRLGNIGGHWGRRCGLVRKELIKVYEAGVDIGDYQGFEAGREDALRKALGKDGGA